MRYDEYISYLKLVLETGIHNETNIETEKDAIFQTLDTALTAFKPNDEKIAKTHNKNRDKIISIIASVYSACKDSPIIKKEAGSQSLTEVFKNSGKMPALPFIVAGPIVRRIEPGAATIWIALRDEVKKLKLSIFDDSNGSEGELILTAEDSTVSFGKSLHIAAITAKPASNKKLEYGKSYLYNLDFGNGQDLKIQKAALAYNVPGISYSLPSFMLPPLDINKVHIIHSSCRNMGNDAYDSMPAVDTLLEKEWKTNRPQQLFLSGDQVYADEGNELLEHLYINTGNTLISGVDANGKYSIVEKISSKEGQPPDVCPAEIIPGERGNMHEKKEYSMSDGSKSFYDLLNLYAEPIPVEVRDYIHDDCGFTPTSRFHVFSLAEFFGLYLLNWSDLLWPAFYHDIASKEWATKLSIAHKNGEEDNLISKLENAKEELQDMIDGYLDKKIFDTARKVLVVLVNELFKFRMVINNLIEMINLVIFASGLAQARRALANISTYMIFDDHEITDDWHMTREWVHRTYSMPMGRRVLQNGLAAFAVFQAWGNTPERFEGTAPGKKLLNALSKWIITDKYSSETTENEIADILKIPNKNQVQRFRDIGKNNEIDFPVIFSNPLSWYFQVNHPKYEVLVLDTRTERSFPGTLYEATNHLSEKALKDQLPSPAVLPAPFGDKLPELTFVISPCNIVTIPMFRNFISGALLPMAQYFKNYKGERWTMTAYDPDQADSWEMGSKLFESFLGRLAVRSYKEHPNDERKSKVVILSGDVHFSYAGRLAYWADKPFTTEENKAHEMVIAHLTASGMKNETATWKTLRLDIIGYEFTDFGNGAVRLPEPEVIVGYAKSPQALNKTKQDEIVLRTRWLPNYKPYNMVLGTPVLLPSHKIHPDVKIPKPEWMYRVDFIRGEKVQATGNVNVDVDLVSHLDIARDQAPSTELIRRSTFASITMDWEGEGKLNEALDNKKEAFTINIAQEKSFPQTPFYIVIDQEMLFVIKTEMAGVSQLKVLNAKRGKAGTTATNHVINSPVKTRKAITQTNWITAEPKKDESIQQLKHVAITRFKVAMSADDLQYAKPKPNTI
jgi:hypothetical protein